MAEKDIILKLKKGINSDTEYGKLGTLGSKCEVFDAELFAIKKAIDFAYEKINI